MRTIDWRNDKEIVEKIKQLFLQGQSGREIAEIYNVSPGAISQGMRGRGIDISMTAWRGRYYEKIKERFLKDVLDGFSAIALGKKYNIAQTTVNRLVRKWTGEKAVWDIRRYKVNDDFFNNLIEEKPRYWLGFIIADGSVGRYSNSPRLTIKIHKKDQRHLEKFQQDIETDNKIFPSKKRKTVTIQITSKQIISDLKGYGVIPRKSFVGTEFSDKVNWRTDSSSWLGAIDGDGWLSYGRDKKGYEFYAIGLCGHERLITQFKEFCNLHGLGINKKIKNNGKAKNKERNKAFTICAKKEVVKLIHLLYDNATIYLDRKHKKAQEILKLLEA